jgi:Protein of unknown function (DUF2865)
MVFPRSPSTSGRFCVTGVWLTALLLIGMLSSLSEAAAQQTSCARIARDMRTLEAGADTQTPAQLKRQAQKTAAQALKITSEMERIGCSQSRFLLWGNDPPAQCGSMQTRVNQLSQRANALLAQSERVPDQSARENRLAKLAAAYEARGCSEAAGQVAGGDTPLPPVDDLAAPGADVSRPVLPISGSKAEQRATAYAAGNGAPGAVCVRMCDGYFFPLSGARSRAQAGQMCQAQCPATETQVFFRRGNNIGTAFSMEGGSYSAIPNAFSFQKSFNPDCSCRQAGESWSEALQGAERLVSARGKPDLVVDEKIAAQWAEVQKSFLGGKGKKRKKQPEEEPVKAAETQPDADQAASAEPAPEPASTAAAGADALGSAIQEFDVPQEEQPLPPAIIDPASGDRETAVQILDDLPAPETLPVQ